jgi:hypothetical protein
MKEHKKVDLLPFKPRTKAQIRDWYETNRVQLIFQDMMRGKKMTGNIGDIDMSRVNREHQEMLKK